MRITLYLVLSLFLALLAIHFTAEESFAVNKPASTINGPFSLENAEEAFVNYRHLCEIYALRNVPRLNAVELRSQNIKSRLLYNLSIARREIEKTNEVSLKYSYNKLVNDIYFWQENYPQKVFKSYPEYQKYLISEN